MKSILQTPFWAEFKSHSGWKSHNIADTIVLTKTIFSKYKMAYIPEVSDKNWTQWLPDFTKQMRDLGKAENLVFARLEIWQDQDEEIDNLLSQQKYKKSFEFVQPEHRRVIDITGSKDEILAQMKQKGRYNIKVAQKHDVTVEIYNDPQKFREDADLAYPLIAGTGSRKNFGVRGKSYFVDLLKTLYENDAGALFIARYNATADKYAFEAKSDSSKTKIQKIDDVYQEKISRGDFVDLQSKESLYSQNDNCRQPHPNKPIVALIISFYDGVADYLYGGSDTEHKEVMAPYLAHWLVIQEAKRRNCRIYDMLGAAPPDEPNHPYAGFARFKEQFGGTYQHLLGSYDLIFKPIHYTIFSQAEKHRRRGVI